MAKAGLPLNVRGATEACLRWVGGPRHQGVHAVRLTASIDQPRHLERPVELQRLRRPDGLHVETGGPRVRPDTTTPNLENARTLVDHRVPGHDRQVRTTALLQGLDERRAAVRHERARRPGRLRVIPASKLVAAGVSKKRGRRRHSRRPPRSAPPPTQWDAAARRRRRPSDVAAVNQELRRHREARQHDVHRAATAWDLPAYPHVQPQWSTPSTWTRRSRRPRPATSARAQRHDHAGTWAPTGTSRCSAPQVVP